MGRQLNLVDMVDAPEHVECPQCGTQVRVWFDDLDVESFNANPEPGVYVSGGECSNCKAEVRVRIKCSSIIDRIRCVGHERTTPRSV